jgi:hypothetical protein
MKLPQLHLRDLFWLVLVAGMITAFAIQRVQLNAATAQLEAIGAEASKNREMLDLVVEKLQESGYATGIIVEDRRVNFYGLEGSPPMMLPIEH